MIQIKTFNSGGQSRRLYLNMTPVGSPRRPGDGTNSDRPCNFLVQFFLRAFFRRHPALLPKGTGPTFLFDGKVGRQTVEGVFAFQTHARRALGTTVFDDSRVSVADGLFVPATKAIWTIHVLNTVAAVILGDAAFNTLPRNAEIAARAPELALELLQAEQLLAAA